MLYYYGAWYLSAINMREVHKVALLYIMLCIQVLFLKVLDVGTLQ